jgi:two-component sensor histidine kinase
VTAGKWQRGGPKILLPEVIVRTLALALHELATNVAKHGALAAERGTLNVTWAETADEDRSRLELRWVEAGVPVPPEKRNSGLRGFGRTLIERALPFQLRAKTHYELGDDGVRYSISILLPIGQQAVSLDVRSIGADDIGR